MIRTFLGLLLAGCFVTTSTAWAQPKWSLNESTSRMDGDKSFVISLAAMKPHRDNFGQPLRAKLMIQCSKKKLDLVFNPDDHFQIGPQIKRHTIRLKFDDSKPLKVWTTESTDSKSVFIDNSTAIVQKLEASKVVLVEYVPWRRSELEIEFNTSNLGEYLPQLKDCGYKPTTGKPGPKAK